RRHLAATHCTHRRSASSRKVIVLILLEAFPPAPRLTHQETRQWNQKPFPFSHLCFLSIIEAVMRKPTSSSVAKQLVISGWGMAVLVWYFHKFSRAFSPIIHGLLKTLWR